MKFRFEDKMRKLVNDVYHMQWWLKIAENTLGKSKLTNLVVLLDRSLKGQEIHEVKRQDKKVHHPVKIHQKGMHAKQEGNPSSQQAKGSILTILKSDYTWLLHFQIFRKLERNPEWPKIIWESKLKISKRNLQLKWYPNEASNGCHPHLFHLKHIWIRL